MADGVVAEVDNLRGQDLRGIAVRADGSDKHLGLGLYVARLIAEGHGGRITAENADGGVRFSLVLPVADA